MPLDSGNEFSFPTPYQNFTAIVIKRLCPVNVGRPLHLLPSGAQVSVYVACKTGVIIHTRAITQERISKPMGRFSIFTCLFGKIGRVKSDTRFPLGAPASSPQRWLLSVSPELPLLSTSGSPLPITFSSLRR